MSTPEVVEAILAHHGVKGMKWGVRRDRPSAVTVTSKRKKLKTKGGYGHPAHSDAVRARTSGQIAKKSGYHTLSNAELHAYNQRLNLEQQAKRLTYQDQSAGKKFVLTMLGRGAKRGTEEATKTALNSARARRLRAIGASAVALA